MFKLLCVGGLEIGQEYDLDDGNYILGRGSSCDIFVIDPKASREHCTLLIADKKAYIEDLNSSNGTLHNDRTVTQLTSCANGDTITVGNTRFQLYSQTEDDYIMNSSQAKLNKGLLIDQNLRDFTTKKLTATDTSVFKKEKKPHTTS